MLLPRPRCYQLLACLSFLLIGEPMALLVAGQPPGKKDEDMAQILQAWKERREKIWSFKCSLKGKMLPPAGGFAPSEWDPRKGLQDQHFVGPKSKWWPMKISLAVHLKKGYVRREEQKISLNSQGLRRPRFEIKVFNGSETKFFRPRKANTSPTYTPDKWDPELDLRPNGLEDDLFLRSCDRPLFFAAGIVPRAWDPPPGKFDKPIDTTAFHLHARTVVGGRNCVVVRTTPTKDPFRAFREYYLDMERQGAILRAALYITDELAFRLDIKHKHTAHGWMPQSWKMTSYRSGRIRFVEDLKVVKLLVNSNLEGTSFDIELRPGMIVYDARKHKAYRVADDGETLNRVVFKNNNKELVEINVRSSSSTWVWVVVVMATLLVFAGGFGIRRWITRKRKTVS